MTTEAELLAEIAEYDREADDIIAMADRQRRRRLGIELNSKLHRCEKRVTALGTSSEADARLRALVERLLRVLWDSPPAPKQSREQELTMDISTEISRLNEQIAECNKELDEILAVTPDKQQRRRLGLQVNGKLARCEQDITKLKDKVDESINQLVKQISEVAERALTELWD